jgi:hypothetical protein
LCIAAVLLAPVALVRAEEAAATKEEAVAKVNVRYDKGPIKAVDAEKKTVDVQTGKQTVHTFMVTPETKFVKDDKEAALSDVVVGKFAKISWIKDGENKLLKKITVLDKDPEKEAGEGEAKAAEPAAEEKK